jgi:tetratricopeptide (TPR) repeat protein
LNDYVKQYREAAETKVRPTAAYMVNELLGYLHTRPNLASFERIKTTTQKSGSKKSILEQTTFKERERRFVIVPELLAPEGYVNFVNIKDDYFVVIPADTDLTNSEVRRAYLQFVIDPIVLSNAKDIESIRPGVKQLLDERRKTDATTSPDVFLTIAKSLVAAIDAKQIEFVKNSIATDLARTRIAAVGGTDPTKKIAQDLEKAKRESADETILRLSEDSDRGAILAFYFADQLTGVEVSQTDIAASMREMLLSFDAAKETGRYAGYADVRKRATLAREERRKTLSVGVASENPVTTKLLEIQDTIKSKNYAKADADLKQLLSQHPSEPRVYFNIGRLAAISAETMEGEAEAAKQRAKYLEAKVAFENVLRIDIAQRKTPAGPQSDPALISLTYVSLGRIFEYYGDRGTALGIYDAAVKLGPVSGGGYQEAFASKQRLIKDQ